MRFYQIFPPFVRDAIFDQSRTDSANTAVTKICRFKVKPAKFHSVSPSVIKIFCNYSSKNRANALCFILEQMRIPQGSSWNICAVWAIT